MTIAERIESRIRREKRDLTRSALPGGKCIKLDAGALWRVICADSTREEDER